MRNPFEPLKLSDLVDKDGMPLPIGDILGKFNLAIEQDKAFFFKTTKELQSKHQCSGCLECETVTK